MKRTLLSWIVALACVAGWTQVAAAQTMVSVTAPDPTASEEGATTGTFVIRRTGAMMLPLLVNCSISGTATLISDYAMPPISPIPPCTVTIPIGENSVTLTATPVDDAVAEGNETIIFTVTPGLLYDVGTPSEATIDIADNDPVVVPTVTVTAPDPNAAEAGLDPGTFSITRTGATTLALTVNCNISGTANLTSDYVMSQSCPATIPAGATSLAITVTPVDDALVEANETIILTATAGLGYVTGTPAAATIDIADNDGVVVPITAAVTAPDPNATEAGLDPGTFSITRTGATTLALTVNCNIGGTATLTSDYVLSQSCPVTIPAGTDSVAITVTPVDDALVEASETITLTVTTGAGYLVGTPAAATISIADNDVVVVPITVAVTAPDPSAAEQGQDPGIFSITRTGATTLALTVNCSISGTATLTSDYVMSTACPVTIPAGAASVAITVTPLDDAVVETGETVILTVTAGAGYLIGTPDTAAINIGDNDVVPITAAVTATDPNAAEAGQDPGTFSITRTGATNLALTVNCSIGGTATLTTDYAISQSCPVTIPAGAASVAIPVIPVDDTVVEPEETVILTVTAGAGYSIGTPASATINIADKGAPISVTVVAPDPDAAEQGLDSGRFLISRTGATTSALTVGCNIGGTATLTSDYVMSQSCPVTISAGANLVTIIVTPVDDALLEANETIVLTVTSTSTDYVVGTPSVATITIQDNDAVVNVTVTTPEPNAAEQGRVAGTFRISRTGVTTFPLTVNCSIGGTATLSADYQISHSCPVIIPPNEQLVTITVTPVDDAILEGDETVALALTPGGYFIETASTTPVTIVDSEILSLTLSSGAGIPASLAPAAPIRLLLNVPAGGSQPGATLSGRVDVGFVPDPQGVEDPNMRFQNGQKTVNFTIRPGNTQPTFEDGNGVPFTGPPAGSVGIQPGTNAGTITFTVVLGRSSTTVVTRVERLLPTISSVAVQRTSDGMTVSVTGFATTREMISVSFAFAGSGGTPSAVLPSGISSAFSAYFARRDAAALANGSIFLLTMPFTLVNGNPNQFNSVRVTMTNSAGSSEMTTTY